MDRHVLGISAYFHDSAAALVSGGRIVAAAQEERFTRRKGDPRFPVSAIAACLRQGGLGTGEIDDVVFYEKPLVKLDRILTTLRQAAPAGWTMARQALPRWAGNRVDVAGDVGRVLGVERAARVAFAEHHESHAASAFFPSPFPSAAILTIDAVGEWATSSIGIGHGSRLELLRETRFPHSLGMLYSAFTAYAGFKVNSGEYKLMGLAPFGEPRFTDRILDEVAVVQDDGSLRLDMDYFSFQKGGPLISPAFAELFGGPARAPESPISQRQMDLAASVQQVCELAVIRAARHARDLTGERNLVLAGGVALNCVATGRLQREGPFDAVWVQPAAGDAGGALGAALLQTFQVAGGERRVEGGDSQQGSLLGPVFTDQDIGLYLDGVGAPAERVDDEGLLLDRVAAWLEAGRVVGWFQGRMEFGPRALGARSILADPRSADMQRKVNAKIKYRESFRPFAPSVLAEHVHDLFDVPPGYHSPYMLATVRVAVPRSELPAVTHVDGSARVQTVDEDRHGRFHRLLRRFHERTGSPVLLNTSFNVRGEPIVCNPHDAYRCFMATDMDCLVLSNFLLVKDDQPPLPGAGAAHRAAHPLD